MTPMTSPALILASSSPRRRELLEAVGLEFEIRAADVDETRLDQEPARDMVLRLAIAKAKALPIAPETAVIGADTAVVLQGEIFSKPRDEEDAVDMLTRLSGQAHEVLTGVAVATADSVLSAVSATVVRFRDIGPDEARRYWHSGEPCDKAGAYAIQGRGGLFVEGIEGSYSGVVGLPIFETAALLQKAGIDTMSDRR
ncbi:MAG: Maf family protein [Woeseiaceae bacterium]|nr:Maf family protein [Woeseiaceae bacterium]